MRFEWNGAKADSNLKKHGVSFREAETVFQDPWAKIFDDPFHSFEEERFIIIGISCSGHSLAVHFTERGETVRIISARRASARERKRHEEV